MSPIIKLRNELNAIEDVIRRQKLPVNDAEKILTAISDSRKQLREIAELYCTADLDFLPSARSRLEAVR
jgi:uncharacterized coiled-coil DUF342 family protein